MIRPTLYDMNQEHSSIRTSAASLLDCEEIQTAPEPDASIIWLHGLGADGHDFVPMVPELDLPGQARIRFLFPHAPVRPVTINQGARMRAWYDISGINLRRDQDQEGIGRSQDQIGALLEREIGRGIDSSRIILAGFSQGGAMALQAGLRFSEPLAGIIALSCYLLNADALSDEAHAANADTPIFFGHGDADPVVPMALGRSAFEALESSGRPTEWHSYQVGHGVVLPEIRDVSHFIQSHLL